MFVSQGNLVFVKLEERVSKAGNPFRIVHFIDKDNFQQIEFFADENLKLNVAPNQSCRVTLKATKMGYSTSMNCLNVEGK